MKYNLKNLNVLLNDEDLDELDELRIYQDWNEGFEKELRKLLDSAEVHYEKIKAFEMIEEILGE